MNETKQRPPKYPEPQNVEYKYFGRPKDGGSHDGIICAAFCPYTEEETLIAFSFCAPGDVFSKKKARELTFKRLWHRKVRNKKKGCHETAAFIIPNAESTTQTVCEAFNAIRSVYTPQWAKKFVLVTNEKMRELTGEEAAAPRQV